MNDKNESFYHTLNSSLFQQKRLLQTLNYEKNIIFRYLSDF